MNLPGVGEETEPARTAEKPDEGVSSAFWEGMGQWQEDMVQARREFLEAFKPAKRRKPARKKEGARKKARLEVAG